MPHFDQQLGHRSGQPQPTSLSCSCAVEPQPSAESPIPISRQMELAARLRKQLDSYRAYSGAGSTSGIVCVSFQCLIDEETEEVGDVAGVVAL